MVVAGVFSELAIAWFHPSYDSLWERWGSTIANAAVLLGVAGEIQFSMMAFRRDKELKRRSDEQVAEARERAAKADLARAELEAKLLPRMLNQDQWDFVQSLRGKFSEIAIAYEVDLETQWFASKLRDAFFSARISVAMYPRSSDVHSAGILIFEPNGFEGARPNTVGPLLELFNRSDALPPLAIIVGSIPSDILSSIENTRPEMRASLDAPMIIVGGQFVLQPPHLEKAAKMAKVAMDAIKTQNRV